MALTPQSKVALAVNVALVVIAGCIAFFLVSGSSSATETVWLAGVPTIGLVSGFTTGASAQTRAGTDFLKFLSGGILVLLRGGVATLLQFRQVGMLFEMTLRGGWDRQIKVKA